MEIRYFILKVLNVKNSLKGQNSQKVDFELSYSPFLGLSTLLLIVSFTMCFFQTQKTALKVECLYNFFICMIELHSFFTDMKYILVTGSSKNDETAQMEILSEDGTTVICPNSKNKYPEILNFASAAVTDGTIVACGGYDGKFF